MSTAKNAKAAEQPTKEAEKEELTVDQEGGTVINEANIGTGTAAAAKINETVTESNEAVKAAAELKLKEQNRKRGNGYPPSVEELEQAEQQAAGQLDKKKLRVRTTRVDGNMHYFLSNRWITHEESLVPDSPWLQAQIAAKKIEIVKD